MKTLIAKALGAAALAAVLATPALAHRQWLLPSQTNFSGQDNWVTVDAAVSNDLFYFEHQPGNITNVKATAPDGADVAIENAAKGRFRNTFDVHLLQKGTYRIGSATTSVNGSYDLAGKTERLPRGTTPETLAKAIPAGATNVQTAESSNRNEIYVSVGAPDTAVFKPTGKGIELVPVTHPNDLVAGEAATFQFLLDGKPATDLKVTVIPGGIRYRDNLNQIDAKTGADGKVSVTYPTPGMYWINVSTPGGGREGGFGGPGGPGGPGAGAPPAEGAAPPAPRAPAGPPQRRASYITTVEVMAP
ncbi:DUF4198 domain-containing protein [Novosphingobium sp. PS1R-30]|uniref:DUF4198 domain-containing protein n=1 Tax=Novosphingobium anseongense TaxID=3133436 RepID=A0ABU8RZN3_9SPHN